VKKWVFALIFGLALLGWSAGAGKESQITCGGEVMTYGYVCDDGSGDVKTYSEMLADKEAAKKMFDTWGRWALLGGGLVVTGGAIAGIVARVRRNRRAASAVNVQGVNPAPHNQMPQPPYSPQPQHPQYPQGQYPPQMPYPQAQYPPQTSYPPQSFGPTGSQG
jgi:hypothetical protein